jgi:hypothetical protein
MISSANLNDLPQDTTMHIDETSQYQQRQSENQGEGSPAWQDIWSDDEDDNIPISKVHDLPGPSRQNFKDTAATLARDRQNTPSTERFLERSFTLFDTVQEQLEGVRKYQPTVFLNAPLRKKQTSSHRRRDHSHLLFLPMSFLMTHMAPQQAVAQTQDTPVQARQGRGRPKKPEKPTVEPPREFPYFAWDVDKNEWRSLMYLSEDLNALMSGRVHYMATEKAPQQLYGGVIKKDLDHID